MFGHLFRPPHLPPAPRTRRRPRLGVEALEARYAPAVYTVDDDGAQRPNADFATIQAAVDAAGPGDTVRVYDGTYAEALAVTGPGKNGLRLVAAGGHARVVAPGGLAGPIILVDGADRVRLQGFLVDGGGNAAGAISAGVTVVGGGSATLRGNTVTGLFHGTDDQSGVAVQVGDGRGTADPSDDSAGFARVLGNTLTGYQKGGVVVEGLGSSALIRGNLIRGAGPTPLLAQNGIEVNGASARILKNTIEGNDFTDPGGTGFAAAGVLVIDTDARTVISGNWVRDNQTGLFLENASGHRLTDNRVTGSAWHGIILGDSDGNVLAGNEVTGNGSGAAGGGLTVVDFEGPRAGTVVTDRFAALGFTVQAQGGANKALIFDSARPTGGDTDLKTPGYGPGNATALGNVLIIGERFKDKDRDGRDDDPDDNAGGGKLTFRFDAPVSPEYIDLLDIEEKGSKVRAYDASGKLLGTVNVPAKGDNSLQRLDLDFAGVSKLVVELAGSGAVAGFAFAGGPPDPAAAIGSGIALFDSSGNVIRANTVRGNGLAGVYVSGGADNRVVDNCVEGNGTEAVLLEDTTGNAVRGNRLRGNGVNQVVEDGASGNTVKNNGATQPCGPCRGDNGHGRDRGHGHGDWWHPGRDHDHDHDRDDDWWHGGEHSRTDKHDVDCFFAKLWR